MSDAELQDYHRFIIDEVRADDEMLTITYDGHVFGGIVRCQLDPDGVEAALRKGGEIFVRYHEEPGGLRGQVAHIIIRHPATDAWAEVYSDEV